MADTVRTLAALQTLLADNTSQDISPQDIRDFLVSVYTGPVLLAESVLGSNANTIEISGIPGTYDHLLVKYQLRASHTGYSTANMNVGNGAIDTGTNYRWYSFGVNSSSSTSAALAEVARNSVPESGDTWAWCLGELSIMNYAAAATRQWHGTHTALSSEPPVFGMDWGQWTNTSDAIDVIRFTANVPPFIAGSFIKVYGVRDVTP